MTPSISRHLRGWVHALCANAVRRLFAGLLLGALSQAAQAGCWIPEFDEGFTWVCSTPTASWVSPPSGTKVAYGQSITLTVNAALGADDESPASLVRVDFYVNGVIVGNVPVSGAQASASYTWTPPSTGTFTVGARAVDNGGQHGAGHPAGTLTTGARSDISVKVNQSPQVTLTAPTNDTVVPGPTGFVSLSANASDADGSVTRVEYLANGNLVATATGAPFSAGWSGAPSGTYLVVARAYDNDGAVSTSTGAYVRVNALPSASLAQPGNGGRIGAAPGSMALVPVLSDPDGAYFPRVEYFVNGGKLGETTAASPTTTHRLDWTNIAAGTYSVFARVWDWDNQYGDSPAITVKVNALPTVVWSSPAAGAIYLGPTASIAMAAAATDADSGIKRVEFLSNDAVVGTATVAPYAFNWNGVPAGLYTLKARVVDNDDATAMTGGVSVRVNAAPVVSVTGSRPTWRASACTRLSYPW